MWYFFFQAEDGIRDRTVTGVQTCALPIWGSRGMMEAANRGASVARGQTIGLNIQLPMEQEVNQYVSRELIFNFHYFFMRKRSEERRVGKERRYDGRVARYKKKV